MRRIAPLSLLLSALSACGADGRAGDDSPILAAGSDAVAATTRVEDGVPVLAHAADAFERAPRFSVDSAPLARLGGGGADSAFDLRFAEHAALLSDGRVATLAPFGGRLLVFAADGRGERVAGVEGHGAGQFLNPTALVRLPGDTLLVYDEPNGRLSLALADEGVIGSSPIAPPPVSSGFAIVAGTLPDGRLVLHSARSVAPGVPDSARRPTTPIVVAEREGRASRVVAEVPAFDRATIDLTRNGVSRRVGVALQLGRRTQVAVWDSLIVTAVGDGWALDLRAPDGRIVGRLAAARARRPVTPAMRETLIARRLARLEATAPRGRGAPREESVRLARESPFADSLPPYSALFVSPAGVLWVVDAIAPTDGGWTATAFRRDGAIVGRLHVPGAAPPVAIDDERVVVRDEDGDGVVTMRVHRIVPAAGR